MHEVLSIGFGRIEAPEVSSTVQVTCLCRPISARGRGGLKTGDLCLVFSLRSFGCRYPDLVWSGGAIAGEPRNWRRDVFQHYFLFGEAVKP